MIPRILFVEDDPSTLRGIAQCLRGLDFHVEGARDGAEALARADL